MQRIKLTHNAITLLVLGVLTMQSMSAYAASFDQAEYGTLMQAANRKGFVRVQIGLNVNVSLADLSK